MLMKMGTSALVSVALVRFGNVFAAEMPVASNDRMTDQAASDRPNIIVILTDDQGYGDLGCYDNPGDVKTPNIDRLAASGMRFTDGYACAAICAPSRAGLLSGRYQQRFGLYHNQDMRDVDNDGFAQQITLPQVLKNSGYVTGCIGKWGLGRKARESRPNQRGFDEFYGFLMSSRGYFGQKSNNPIYRNETVVEADDGYLTDSFNRESVDFINRHAGKKPFFLYLPYNAPHYPLEAREDYSKLFDTGNKSRDTYLAMLKSVDEGVGMIEEALKKHGIYENTLIFFLSDNGPDFHYGGRNGALRGAKGDYYEGGMRVPFIVSWPARIPAGKVCSVPIMAFDIFPTTVAVAGGKMPDDRIYDGRNMLPLLTGEAKGTLHETLVWQHKRDDPQWALRQGDWKLVSVGKDTVQLFNLANDLKEQTDLAADDPEKVKELVALHNAWEAEMK